MAYYFSPPATFTPSQPLPEEPIEKRLQKAGLILDDPFPKIVPFIPQPRT